MTRTIAEAQLELVTERQRIVQAQRDSLRERTAAAEHELVVLQQRIESRSRSPRSLSVSVLQKKHARKEPEQQASEPPEPMEIDQGQDQDEEATQEGAQNQLDRTKHGWRVYSST